MVAGPPKVNLLLSVLDLEPGASYGWPRRVSAEGLLAGRTHLADTGTLIAFLQILSQSFTVVPPPLSTTVFLLRRRRRQARRRPSALLAFGRVRGWGEISRRPRPGISRFAVSDGTRNCGRGLRPSLKPRPGLRRSQQDRDPRVAGDCRDARAFVFKSVNFLFAQPASQIHPSTKEVSWQVGAGCQDPRMLF